MLIPSILLLLAAPAPAQEPSPFAALQWRSIGPTVMGGRVVDLAVDPERPATFYVASASGGLWKTDNQGLTFRPVFEREGSSSLGAVAVAPSAPQVVWVGTGEANPRNSVSWGDGVYVSEDGGGTWAHRGLADSRHIGAIAVHPTEPGTVFVAAMGSTWGPSEQRGLYRSRDGGGTWERVLSVDDQTGAIDVVVHPRDPHVVLAATWQRQRDAFDGGDPAVRTGPGSGLWRSTDGGDTWERLAGGLPTRPMGRIGLCLWEADPDVVFAMVETDLTGRTPPGAEEGLPAWLGVRGQDAAEIRGYELTEITGGGPAEQAGLQVGDVVLRLAEEEVADAAALRTLLGQYRSGDTVELTVQRGDEILTLSLTFRARPGSSGASAQGSQGGQGADAQGRQGDQGHETGGLFRSDDRGTTWRRLNSINPRPFYYSQVRVDPTDDQQLYVLGIQLHHSADGGRTFDTLSGQQVHPDHHALWIDPANPEHMLLGNDGGLFVTWDRAGTWEFLDRLPIGQFYNVAVDLRRPYRVYGGLQDNGSWGGPTALADRDGVRPEDWIKVGGGDGFHCAVDRTDPDLVYSESQNGFVTRRNLETGEVFRVQAAGRGARFNWNTPFLLSPHSQDTLYLAGDEVLCSVDQGRTTRSLTEGIQIPLTERGTATALAESPRRPGLLYVGTDDGALWVSPDGGRLWESMTGRLPGLPAPRYVSDLEASHHDTDTVYVTLDGHRQDDNAPYVYRSRDAGLTFEALHDGLPPGAPVRCLAESPANRNLLFVGTEFGIHVSLDEGATWTDLRNNLPTVAVHDLVLHPRDADLVAGTHGRGIWILDVHALEQVTTRVLRRDFHLFEVEDVHPVDQGPAREWSGTPRFFVPNPETGVAIRYYLREDQDEEVTVSILDVLGNPVALLRGPGKAGVQGVFWNLRTQGRGTGPANDREYVAQVERGDEVLRVRIRIDPPAPPVITIPGVDDGR